MKILELRFKNLNSLYGEWKIDFTSPEYVSNGIFALTGPTGAGKSTILDAICLALYGTTPRLDKITKSSNEIMSRQTGECFAEVLFESQAGKFRCHWGQHRARKKSNGKLADARHEISDAETGKPIETKKSLVPGVIIDKTGMDYDRFTRSILLAQGGFDSFLKADIEQKSKILEQITGTEIYTEISRRVHELQRNEREKLKLLQAETSGIVILDPEQENEIKLNLETKQNQEIKLVAHSTKMGKAINWLNGIDGLKKEISFLSKESEKLEIENEAFKTNRELLTQALKATELDGEYATLTVMRKQQAEDQTSLKAEVDKLPNLETSNKQNQETLKVAKKQTDKTKEDLKKATPLIQKIRSLDQKLADQKKMIETDEVSCKKNMIKIDSTKQLKHKEQEKHIEACNDLKLVEQYLKNNLQDEWLVSGLAGIKEQLNSLLSKQQEIIQMSIDEKKANTTLDQTIKKLKSCIKQFGIRKQELEGAVKSVEQGKNLLHEILGDQLLREYRTEKENLLKEMAYLVKIAQLEVHRAELKDDNPCPLCGSKEHPFAMGNIPAPDETEKRIKSLSKLIQKAEDQEAVIKKLETNENTVRKNLAESEKLEIAATNEKQTAEKSISDLTGNLNKIRSDFAELKKSVLAKLQPLGFEEIPNSDVSELLKSLQERLKKWHAQVKEKSEIEKKLFELDSEVKRINAVIDTLYSALVEKQEILKSVKKEYDNGNVERHKLYGDKKTGAEENRLHKMINDAELVEKKVRTLYDEAQQELNSTTTKIKSLKERTKKRVSELKQLEFNLKESLQLIGFSDEKQFLEARLSVKERDDLKAKTKYLDDWKTDLKARQKDRKNRLDTEISKNVTDKLLEELDPQFKELEGNIIQLRDIISGLKYKLTENTASKKRIKEKQEAIESQKKECHRWEKLHGLIGSADGKKFRNFAQGLTFEMMVSHANRQLEKMNDRYLLIRDDEQPLELNVIDNYQAGEIRSTKNLSGGESFIVSLTLALGLSKMASRKVRVDSLFLDEGFGTLDEDTLETALETLSGLQQDGKLIGVISHVLALKERISTQINVTPVSSGKSTLTGPGCSKV